MTLGHHLFSLFGSLYPPPSLCLCLHVCLCLRVLPCPCQVGGGGGPVLREQVSACSGSRE